MHRMCRLESIVVPPSIFSSGPMRMKTCRPARVPQWTCGSSTSLAADMRDLSPSIVPAQPSSCGMPSAVGPWSSGRTARAFRSASTLYSDGSRIASAEPSVVLPACRRSRCARRARPARPRSRSAGISTASTITAGTAKATTGTQLGAACSASKPIRQR